MLAQSETAASDGSRRHDNDATEVRVRHEWESLSGTGRPGDDAVKWHARFAAILLSCPGIDPWLARPRSRGFSWDFAFQGRLLLTNRPQFHAQQRSRSSRRSIAPLDICKPKAPPG